ncbi:MAG: DUF4140 domain-containing protein, partial [Sandaracinaceae bacterium]
MATVLSSRIDSVTVYRRGAIVTRVAELSRDAGDELTIGPLPLSIDDGSVRVKLEDADGCVVTDVRIGLEVPTTDVTLPPARPEELGEAERRVARLRARLEQRRRERARIEGLGVLSRPEGRAGRPPPASPASSRLALLDLRSAKLGASDEELAALEDELRVAERELASLKDREKSASSARNAASHELRKVVRAR